MEKNKRVKLNIRKGDLVKVIAGDSKGQQGKVLQVITKNSRILVEAVNMVSKHTKPSAASPNGGIIKKEAAIHVSNLMLVDPASGKTTRVGRKVNAEGKTERIAKKTGEVIK